jgi:hypothetical protein
MPRTIPDRPAAVRPAEESLQAIAHRINSREKRSREATLRHVRQQGDDLFRAKAKCGHGKWEKWAKEHLEMSPRQAQYYLRFKNEVTADLPEEEQWELWQTIQGNPPGKGKRGGRDPEDKTQEPRLVRLLHLVRAVDLLLASGWPTITEIAEKFEVTWRDARDAVDALQDLGQDVNRRVLDIDGVRETCYGYAHGETPLFKSPPGAESGDS